MDTQSRTLIIENRNHILFIHLDDVMEVRLSEGNYPIYGLNNEKTTRPYSKIIVTGRKADVDFQYEFNQFDAPKGFDIVCAHFKLESKYSHDERQEITAEIEAHIARGDEQYLAERKAGVEETTVSERKGFFRRLFR